MEKDHSKKLNNLFFPPTSFRNSHKGTFLTTVILLKRIESLYTVCLSLPSLAHTIVCFSRGLGSGVATAGSGLFTSSPRIWLLLSLSRPKFTRPESHFRDSRGHHGINVFYS